MWFLKQLYSALKEFTNIIPLHHKAKEYTACLKAILNIFIFYYKMYQVKAFTVSVYSWKLVTMVYCMRKGPAET